MTFFQFLKSYKYCLADNFKTYSQYRKMFKNSLGIIYRVKRKKYPIKCKLKKGGTAIFNRHFEIMNTVFAEQYGISFDKEKDLFSGFSVNSSPVTLFGGEGAGDAEPFVGELYASLPVKEKVVVDIGANIGDTPIYFILQGAKKVVGLEPHPKIFEIAKENIEKNQLSGKIQLLLAGCSSKPGSITIDPDTQTGIRSRLEESKDGLKIPLIPLEKIIDDSDMESAVLKLDCEGCEFDVILNSSHSTLRKFSHIFIEYHYGYKNLKKKLEECGFQVSVTDPRYTLDTKMYTGYLHAS